MGKINRYITAFFLFSTLLFVQAIAPGVALATASPIGIHILNPEEIEQADSLLSLPDDDNGQPENYPDWRYVTIPLTLDSLEKPDDWEVFFTKAREKKIIPLVRLATRVEDGAWVQPTRKNITDQIAFLQQFQWPTEEKYIIVYNEVNHAKEWGNEIDPESYAQTLAFAADWAHSEQAGFVVLPAALDLAAPNGSETMESFAYLDQMLATNPDIFEYVDAWNSHAYANPHFSSSPQNTGKMSLRGFEHELAYLKEKTGRDYRVYITETGWEVKGSLARWLPSYYLYAFQHIWSHPQVAAVTPFLLKGSPGPFSGFSFIDENNQPTIQYSALQDALAQVNADVIELSFAN